MTAREIRLCILEGLTPYAQGLSLQRETVALRQKNRCSDTLFLVEHPPVITLGASAGAQGVLATHAVLSDMGVEIHQIERGGQATWHGPGQIVGYPVMNLHELNMGVARYVASLEDVMIRASEALGAAAIRRAGITGVFSAEQPHGKLGAIGVRVSRGVTWHGFAFNVCPDLSYYRLIVPCGHSDIPVASLETTLGRPVDIQLARSAIAGAFMDVFGAHAAATAQQ